MGLKKKERHPLRKIKELFSKVGTLNLILIIVGAFFCVVQLADALYLP